MVKMTSLILSNALKQNLMHKSLQKSEKRLKFALLAGNLGTYEFNLITQTKYYDERFANFFGYSSGTLNKNQNWFENNIHPNFLEAYRNFLNQCLDGEKNYFEQEYKIRCKDESYKWISDWGIVTEVNNDGIPLKMVGIIQDISHRKNTEKALIFAKEKAEENEKLKTAFLANVSHEIRTPMNGITGFAELLYNNMVSDNDKHHYLEIIWKNSNRLLTLINNILDISKLETNQLTIFNHEYSLNQLITDIHTQFKTQIEKNNNIEFRIISSVDATNCIINTDESRLNQILTNLIENAFKFTRSGSIEVLFDIDNSCNLIVQVKDTGSGIPREFHSRLFNRFSQSDLTINQNMGGTGLGLPISKGLVEALGGNIWVKSLKGVGSTFYFTIPLQPVGIVDEKVN
jgi:PAS domain S-box-containing protein